MSTPINTQKLALEMAQLEKVIANSERQLSNPDIISKMPEKVVNTLRQKKGEYESQLAKIRSTLAAS